MGTAMTAGSGTSSMPWARCLLLQGFAGTEHPAVQELRVAAALVVFHPWPWSHRNHKKAFQRKSFKLSLKSQGGSVLWFFFKPTSECNALK